jgi:pyridoxal phosphate enzyme (YggS family)
MMGEPSSTIAENLHRVRERIARAAARAGRRAHEIALVAVSKTQSADAIRAAYEAGVREFGENRVQEWESKRAVLSDLVDARWHLIGHLQSNKARRAAQVFDYVDSLDSAALAQKLDAAMAELGGGKRLGVLLEVRVSPEATKSGVEASDLPGLMEAVLALPQLDLRGLMCIPPFFEDAENARPFFRQLRELRDVLRAPMAARHPERSEGSPPFELSMGMSHDFEVAIEEGATQVRVGTALFGARGAK